MTDFSMELLVRLVIASLMAGLMAGVAWWLTRRVPGIPPVLRAALWWLVCFKFVVALLFWPGVPLPVLEPDRRTEPAPYEGPIAERPGRSTVDSRDGAAAPKLDLGRRVGSDRFPEAPGRLLDGLHGALDRLHERSQERQGLAAAIFWAPIVLLSCWLIVAAIGTLRLIRHGLRAQRLRDAAGVLDDPRVVEMLDGLARQLGARAELRHHPDCPTPQLIGWRRPTIVLPSGLAVGLNDEELRSVLAHELVHVRRRDLWWSLVPALTERLFFFHPLARLAAREFAVAQEAACDAAVLRSTCTHPADYGRLLLKLSTGAAPWPSAGMAAPPTLKRRLQMLATPRRRVAWLPCCLVALVFVVLMVPLQPIARGQDSPPRPKLPALATTAPADPVAPAPALPRVLHVETASAEIPKRLVPVAAASPAMPKVRPVASASTLAPQAPLPVGSSVAPLATTRSLGSADKAIAPVGLAKSRAWHDLDSVDAFALFYDSSIYVHGDWDAPRTFHSDEEKRLELLRDGDIWIVRDESILLQALELLQYQRKLERERLDQHQALGHEEARLHKLHQELEVLAHYLESQSQDVGSAAEVEQAQRQREELQLALVELKSRLERVAAGEHHGSAHSGSGREGLDRLFEKVMQEYRPTGGRGAI